MLTATLSNTAAIPMATPKTTTRLTTLDALRGLAALAIALYHLIGVTFAVAAQGSLGAMIFDQSRVGRFAVPLFFAISGFVIAASLSDKVVTGRFFGRFMLRRSIRLDPTYWASITVDILLTAVSVYLVLPNAGLPSIGKVILHLFYAQDLAGVGDIAAVYWTLCYEIQSYLVFCIILFIANRWKGLPLKGPLFFLVTAYSCLVVGGVIHTPLHGLFVDKWPMFAAGIAAYQWGVKEQSGLWKYLLVVLFVTTACHDDSVSMAFSFASLFYWGARYNKLGTWLSWPALLYLGSRSYSIYLFHTIIGERFIKLANLVFVKMHFAVSELTSVIFIIMALGISLIAAELSFQLIERPTLRLSKAVK